MKRQKQYKPSPQMLANFARAAEVYKDVRLIPAASRVPLTNIERRHYGQPVNKGSP